jgi:protein TonB
MERPVNFIQRRRQFSPRMIAAISGAVVFEAAAIYVVATGLTFSGIRAIPHTLEAEVFRMPPPKVEPVVVPQVQLVKPSLATVPPPEIQIQTPQPPPQITVAKMPPHPVMPPPVQTAATPVPPPPAPPKPQGITAPVSIGRSHSCENEYPPSAQRLNQEGTTTLKFTVSTDGSVSDVHVVGSSGHDALDEAAIRCASSWRYKPALENGQPVSAPWTTDVQWKLQNGSTSM